MSGEKKELAVAGLRNGTVIDHIPTDVLFKAADLLGIADMKSAVTIGNNLESKRLGKKGIIKVADVEFPSEVLSRIAIIAPTAVINIIRDYKVVDKHPVVLPDEVIGIVECANPKCITRNEPMLSRFHVVSREPVVLRCHYCEHDICGDTL
jgi:aspartate carbamoyltransferase regulatory subunit